MIAPTSDPIPHFPGVDNQTDYDRFLAGLRAGQAESPMLLPKWQFSTPSKPRPVDPEDAAFEQGLQMEKQSQGAASAGRMTLFFPHGSTSLLPQHTFVLDQLGRQLKAGMWIEMYSICDRTGSRAVNYQVSKARLNEVQNRLLRARAPRHLVMGSQNKYFGEDYAEFGGKLDDRKQNNLRSVTIYFWLDMSTARYIFADRYLVKYGRATRQP